MLKIVIGSDHRGFNLKKNIIKYKNIGNIDISWIDVGTNSLERTDYPIYGKLAVEKMLKKEADLGILICGSGIGMAVVANRYNYIYAGVVFNKDIAKVAKEDDNINVLVFPADFIGSLDYIEVISIWLKSQFKGGRYQERLDMLKID